MQDQARDGRTLAWEDYFIEFSAEIRKIAKMPIMVTGGIWRKTVAENVIDSCVEMVGMGTALALASNLPNMWIHGEEDAPELKTDSLQK